MRIKLPDKCFYTVEQLAERWAVLPAEIEHLFETSRLTKRHKMAVIEGLEDAEYVSVEIHDRPSDDFDLMPTVGGIGCCVDGINFGREVRIDVYLGEEINALPPEERTERINAYLDQHFPDALVGVVTIEDVLAFEKRYAAQEASQERSLADRAHVSDKLARLNQAAQRFWGNADRDDRATHPTNSDVVAWLQEHGYTQTLAEKAATIIRPDWAPTGRKPEE
jgi:hypothetical protein